MGTKLKFDTYDLGSITSAVAAAGQEIQIPDRYSFLTFIAFNPVGGVGNATASVQISPDNGGTWATADSTSALTAGVYDKKEFDPPAPLVRMQIAPAAGTPTIYGRVIGVRDKDIKSPHQRVVSGTVSLAAGSQNVEVALDRLARRIRIYAVWVGGTGNVLVQGTFDSSNYFTVITTATLSSGVPIQQTSLSDHFFRHFRFTFTRTAGTFQAFAVVLGLNQEE